LRDNSCGEKGDRQAHWSEDRARGVQGGVGERVDAWVQMGGGAAPDVEGETQNLRQGGGVVPVGLP
jgi:hypothetical protein